MDSIRKQDNKFMLSLILIRINPI